MTSLGLYLPPFEAPFAANPHYLHLAACVGGAGADVRDFNLDLWNHLTEEQHVTVELENASARFRVLHGKPYLAAGEVLDYYPLLLADAMNPLVGPLIRSTPAYLGHEALGDYGFDEYLTSKHFLQLFLNVCDAGRSEDVFDHVSILGPTMAHKFVVEPTWSDLDTTSTRLLAHEYIETMAKEIARANPSIIAFFADSVGQFIYADAVAQRLRQSDLSAHIVAVGRFPRDMRSWIGRSSRYFRNFDGFAVGSTAACLTALQEVGWEPDQLAGIPNLMVRTGEQVTIGKADGGVERPEIDALLAALPHQDYWSRYPVLPVVGTVDHPLTPAVAATAILAAEVREVLDVRLVGGEFDRANLAALAEQLPPNPNRRVSLLARPNATNEPGLLERARACGVRTMRFALTPSDLDRKGRMDAEAPPSVATLIASCRAAGILPVVGLVVGAPEESIEVAERAVQDLSEDLEHYPSYHQVSEFQVSLGSLPYESPEAFGIELSPMALDSDFLAPDVTWSQRKGPLSEHGPVLVQGFEDAKTAASAKNRHAPGHAEVSEIHSLMFDDAEPGPPKEQTADLSPLRPDDQVALPEWSALLTSPYPIQAIRTMLDEGKLENLARLPVPCGGVFSDVFDEYVEIGAANVSALREVLNQGRVGMDGDKLELVRMLLQVGALERA